MNFFKRKSCCYFHSLFSFVGIGTSLIILLSVISSLFIPTVSGIKCYICGTQDVNSEDMVADPCWETDPLKEQFALVCPTDSDLCSKYTEYKHVEGHGHDEDSTGPPQLVSVVRGCAKRTADDGVEHQWFHSVKCGSTSALFAKTAGESPSLSCFCDTDYCNHQSGVKPSSIILSLVLSIHLTIFLLKSRRIMF